MKVCSKCKIEQDDSEFRIRNGRSKNAKPYLNNHCKICESDYKKIYLKKYSSENRDKLNAYHKKWSENNISRIRESQKRARNIPATKEYRKKWAQSNRDKKRASNKKWEQTHIEKFREIQKSNLRRKRNNLDDHYLRRVLRERGFTKELIDNNPELIEAQKIIIKTKRLCKTLQNSETV